MADVSAVNYTLNFDTNPPAKVPSNVQGGRRRVLYDSYEAVALPDGDVIQFGKLGDGAVIHDFHVMNDALGAGTTIQLATRADAPAATEVDFSQAIDTSTAGSERPDALDIDDLPVEISEPVTVIAKLVGGNATGTLKVWIEYSIT